MSGLQRFIRGTGDIFKEPFFDIDSKPEDAERVLVISYQAYFTTLHFFLQVFNTYDSAEYKHFKEYSKIVMEERSISK